MESIRVILARLEERLGNLADNNTETHDKICMKLDTLTEHVNHENEKMDTRISYLEDQDKASKTVGKTKRNLYKDSAAILATALTIVGILAAFRII
jgi:hypothetical protein